MTDYSDARAQLIQVANDLRRCLSVINTYGDHISPRLVAQADGFVYGEVYDGLKILVAALYPDDGIAGRADKILDVMLDSSLPDIESAAQDVADTEAPMSEYSTDEVRDELAKYRAWQRTLNDGLLPPERLVGTPSKAEATAWLGRQIAECLAALAYRNEPEVANA